MLCFEFAGSFDGELWLWVIFVGFLGVVMEFEFLAGCVALVLRVVCWAVFARVGELHCG